MMNVRALDTCNQVLLSKSTFFSNDFPGNAVRIISAGGFYINQNQTKNIAEVISPSVHVLENGLTLFRVGKKNYTIVSWLT